MAQTIKVEELQSKEVCLLSWTIRQGFAEGLGLELWKYDSELQKRRKTFLNRYDKSPEVVPRGRLRDTERNNVTGTEGRS